MWINEGKSGKAKKVVEKPPFTSFPHMVSIK